MPYLFLFYIVLCFLVGIIGMNRKFGFWGYFFASFALTPFIGLIMVFASGKRKTDERT